MEIDSLDSFNNNVVFIHRKRKLNKNLCPQCFQPKTVCWKTEDDNLAITQDAAGKPTTKRLGGEKQNQSATTHRTGG